MLTSRFVQPFADEVQAPYVTQCQKESHIDTQFLLFM